MVKRQPNDDDFYITDMYSQLAVCSNLLASSEKSLPKENQSLLNAKAYMHGFPTSQSFRQIDL